MGKHPENLESNNSKNPVKLDSSIYNQLGLRSLGQALNGGVDSVESSANEAYDSVSNALSRNNLDSNLQNLSQNAGIAFNETRQFAANEFNKFDYWYTNSLLSDVHSGNFGLPTISAIAYPEISYPLIIHRLFNHIDNALKSVNDSIGAH